MRWSHVDLAEKTWTIPDTKMGRPHVVPLSDAALRVLGRVKRFRDPLTDSCFLAPCRHRDLRATLRYLIADMGYKGLATTHGFRATFKTWAWDTTAYEKGVVEAALAHAQAELDSAYHRGSYLSKRKKIDGGVGRLSRRRGCAVGGLGSSHNSTTRPRIVCPPVIPSVRLPKQNCAA